MSEIIKKLQQLENDSSDKIKKSHISLVPPPPKKIKKNNTSLIIISAAALVIILGGSWGGYRIHNKKLAAQRKLELLKKRTIDPVAQNNKAIAAFKHGNYKTALSEITPLVTKDLAKMDMELLNNYAVILKYNRDHKKSLEVIGQAIKLNSKNATLYNNRGTIFLTQEKFTLALIDFKKALEISPTYINAILNMGITYEKIENWAKAKESYMKYIASKDSSSNVTKILKKRLMRMYPLLLFQTQE